jgi:hypothetical protein
MNILIGCEYSGKVRDAFRARGHNAISCDLEQTDVPGPHYQGDVRDMIWGKAGDLFCHRKWDFMIAHPPCTFLCNSGIRWLHEDDTRWAKMIDATDFFKELLNAPIPRIVIENPRPHIYAEREIGMKQSQIIQPYQFNNCDESKETYLWLKNLPRLRPTATFRIKDTGIKQSIFKMGPSENRGRKRSLTFEDIALAMAEQWG